MRGAARRRWRSAPDIGSATVASSPAPRSEPRCSLAPPPSVATRSPKAQLLAHLRAALGPEVASFDRTNSSEEWARFLRFHAAHTRRRCPRASGSRTPLFSRARAPENLALTPNDDLRSRVTYSALLQKLAPDDIAAFVRAELDRAGLPHAVLTADALALVVRASDGVLRRVRNLCLGALLEAVRDRTKTVDLKQINRVLLHSLARTPRRGVGTRRERRRTLRRRARRRRPRNVRRVCAFDRPRAS